jgi:hypothetical protein
MNKKINALPALALIISLTLACASTAPTQNPQATIDAAIQGTMQAQGTMQSAVDTAVRATLTAQPTPDVTTISEEELAAMIDEAVAEALADSQSTTTTVASSTSDGAVTTEEAAAATTDVYETANEIAYAEDLIQAYYDYYGEYANEALDTLGAMEDDLAAVTDSLSEIAAIYEQGAEAASAAIEQLNAAAQSIQEKATQASTRAQEWVNQVKTNLGQREKDILDIKPDQVASDRTGALNQAHDFLEGFKSALADGKFSPDELNQIGQLAANARASLKKTGDGPLQGLGGMIENLTRNAARGEWNRARSGLGDFERTLPALPRRP